MAITFTYNEATNTVVLSEGTIETPATFDDFVTFDRAGTAELLAAEACGFNHTLTYPVRPVEDLAITIDFVLDSTSADVTQEWTAASANLTTGTVIGTNNVTDTYTDDGNSYSIEEVNGTPAMDFDFTWSGLPTNYYPEKVFVRGFYLGSATHDVLIYMWNYDTSAWDRLTAATRDFPTDTSDQDYTFNVPAVDTENYFSSGAAKIRINHIGTGINTHQFHVNQIVFQRDATNNTLDITGTSFDGSAQNESIDVSGGDDTYNGTKKWATITDIDCNGWDDGTLEVNQGSWGVIWDFGGGQYQVDAVFEIGNGTTPTYFSSVNELVYYNTGASIEIFKGGSLTLGIVGEDSGINGSYWNFANGTDLPINWPLLPYTSSGAEVMHIGIGVNL